MNCQNVGSFQKPYYVGIDVGGTNIKIGVVDDRGMKICDGSLKTQPTKTSLEAFSQVKQNLNRMLKDAGCEWSDVAAVGLGTPGPLDAKKGTILTPSNLPGWHHSPVQQQLASVLDRPVLLTNDANAAAFGEYWVGSGQEHDSLVMLTLGTGVGGGIIYKGLSIEGFNSHGSELGHITIDSSADARLCGCGQRGHLEAYASASALVARTQERLSSVHPADTHSLLSQQISRNSPLSALMIAQAASAGDDLAVTMINETATYLAAGIAVLSYVIDPAAFILGGAMDFGGKQSLLGEKFLHDVVSQARQRVFPVVADRLTVDFAKLGGAAGFVGAAGLARRAVQKNRPLRE
jgi:glucokinase